jgi:hypothetical protein
MTDLVRIRGAEVVQLGHDRAAISGTLGQVGEVLGLLRRAGQLRRAGAGARRGVGSGAGRPARLGT